MGWLGATIAGGIILTDIILKDTLTPQRNLMISTELGRLVGIGLGLIWIIAYLKKKK